MTRLPPFKAREVIKGLQDMGFEQDCRRAPIPIHPAKTISRYLLSDILKQLEIDEEEFLQAIGRR